MTSLRHIGIVGVFAAVAAVGCGASGGGSEEPRGVTSSAAKGGEEERGNGNGNGGGASSGFQCHKATAKDSLISGLVYDSWVAAYPLTRLSVDAAGNIVAASPPDLIAGDLEVINTVPSARDSIARALRKIGTLPDYGMAGIGFDNEACASIPAWTPAGTVTITTDAFWVHTDATNPESWTTVHKEFGKECPLVKRTGNRDIIDPPGDGSTMAPPSATVSATGVIANSWGLCPAGTTVGTYCKLSYATGVNWSGRWCQYYYGQLRCVLK